MSLAKDVVALATDMNDKATDATSARLNPDLNDQELDRLVAVTNCYADAAHRLETIISNYYLDDEAAAESEEEAR